MAHQQIDKGKRMDPIHDALWKKHDECTRRLSELETGVKIADHQIKALEQRMDRFILESERSRAEVIGLINEGKADIKQILAELYSKQGRDRFAAFLTPVAVTIVGILIAIGNYLK